MYPRENSSDLPLILGLSGANNDESANELRRGPVRIVDGGHGVDAGARSDEFRLLAILCRANSPDVTKDLRKVLLGFKATGNSHVQYSRIGSTQHQFGALEPSAQNKLMRGLAR